MTGTDPSAASAKAVTVSRRRLLAWSGAAGAAGVTLGSAGTALVGDTSPHHPSGDSAPPTRDVQARLAPADARALDTGLPMGLAERIPAFGTILAFDLASVARTSPSTARATSIAFLRHLAQRADEAGIGATLSSLRGLDAAAAALDLRSANLQITPGFGASFLRICRLERQRPGAMVDIPGFATDRLDPSLCDGDLLVQVGSEDPLKTNAIVQDVLSAARANNIVLRWSRPGFRSTSATEENPATTTRNVMGHRDGTANQTPGSPLWQATVIARGADWMTGGSYLVARQIRLDLDTWFSQNIQARDRVIGRRTGDGAALGERTEQQAVDLSARTAQGELVIPSHAHIRLANPQNTGGARIYRRSWNFDDGQHNGHRNTGLMFLAWQADPRLGFIPIQQELVEGHDDLSRFATHVGSALFAVPARSGDDYVGQHLLEGS